MVTFSTHEQMILKILGSSKMTIHQLSEGFYGSRSLPFEGRNYVAKIIRRISAKCEIHKLRWTIKGKGGGRGGRTVWRGVRKIDPTGREN